MSLLAVLRVLVQKVLYLRPVVVIAVLLSVGVSVHSWHSGWLWTGSQAVQPEISQFVHISGFASPETSQILVALEGLLSAACKHHPSCSETQADTQEERLHALRFGADSSETTLVYYTAADQDGLRNLLKQCTEQHAASGGEAGSTYRCFQGAVKRPTTIEELNGKHYLSLQQMGVEDLSVTAARKQIFIASDPKVEAARAALQHCEWDAELDRKLHTLRATFRSTLEWLGWQQQALRQAAEVDEVLVLHAQDFNTSALETLRQVAGFLGVGHRTADLRTAAGQVTGMGEPAVAALTGQLPRGLQVDIEGFAHEAIQDPRFVEPYLEDPKALLRARSEQWPPPALLAQVAQDNSLLVTTATCGGVLLAANWMRTLQNLQMEVYLVVAQDCTAFAALEAVAPGHVVLAQHLMPEEAGYASPGSKQMRQVTAQIPGIIGAILAQGYNVAWSEADVVWRTNPFEHFFKSHELVAVYESQGMPETGGISRPGERFLEKHPLATGFFFMRQSPHTQALLEAWEARMTAARPEEEGEAFAHALRGDVAKALDLAVLPMPPFPTPAQALPDGGAGPGVHEAFKEAWQVEPQAWLHVSSASSLDDKVALLKREGAWVLEASFKAPGCAAHPQ